jgi:hypothetical protein
LDTSFGHFKTDQLKRPARPPAQVTGFQMAGELLGLDAVSGDRHPATPWGARAVKYARFCFPGWKNCSASPMA